MDPFLSFKRLLDGLIGGEMGELDEWTDAVEDLEGGDYLLAMDGGERERGVYAKARTHQPRRHGLREVGGDALRGGSERRRELGNL